MNFNVHLLFLAGPAPVLSSATGLTYWWPTLPDTKESMQKAQAKMLRDTAFRVLFKHLDMDVPEVDGLFSCMSQYLPSFA